MNKREIYILLRHELEQRLSNQDELIQKLDADVRAAISTATASPQAAPDAPHEAPPESNTLAAVFRNDANLKRWLLASGVDSFQRLQTLMQGLSPERVEELRAVMTREGY